MRTTFLPICLFMVLLVSCNYSQQDLKQAIETIKKIVPPNIDKLPEFKTYIPIRYVGDKLNDPFSTAVGEKNPNTNSATVGSQHQTQRPDFNRPREYLENFPLDTLTMVGKLERKNESWALIVDRNGILHKIKEGNYLGQNSGKIVKINEEDLEIEEIVNDGQGGWTSRNASIGIQHK